MNQTVSLYYQESGSGSPLVLLHGFPLDHTIWDPLLPFLTPQARVITPDLRGHGRSPAPQGSYSMGLIANDVAVLLDRLQIERCVLAGHSMGGYAALAFARAYPGRLSALALVASHASADAPERAQGRLDEAEQVAQAGTAQLVDGMAGLLTADPGLVEPLRQIMARTPRQGVVGALQGMAARKDANDFLAELDLPVLLVAGDQDAIIPLERTRALAARLQRGRLVVVPRAGHMPMLENPQVVGQALLELITQ